MERDLHPLGSTTSPTWGDVSRLSGAWCVTSVTADSRTSNSVFMADAGVWPRPCTTLSQLGTAEPHFTAIKSPNLPPGCAQLCRNTQSMRGLRTTEKQNKAPAVLMLTSNLVGGAELLFERLEPRSTRTPRRNTNNPSPGQSPPGPGGQTRGVYSCLGAAGTSPARGYTARVPSLPKNCD